MIKPRQALFKWRHFEPEVIVCAVDDFLFRTDEFDHEFLWLISRRDAGFEPL